MYSYTVRKVLEYIGVYVNPETLLKKWLIYWEPLGKDFHNDWKQTTNEQTASLDPSTTATFIQFNWSKQVLFGISWERLCFVRFSTYL